MNPVAMRLTHIRLLFLLMTSWAFSVSATTVAGELARARENVHIADATVARIEADIQTLEANPETAPAVLEARRDYLTKVKRLRDEHHRILTQMEQLAREGGVDVDFPSDLATNRVEEVHFGTPDVGPLDEVELLELELHRALGEYDDILRKSQAELAGKLQELRANSSSTLNGLAQEAAAAAGKAGAAGSAGGQSGSAGNGSESGGAGEAGETKGKEGKPGEGELAGQGAQKESGAQAGDHAQMGSEGGGPGEGQSGGPQGGGGEIGEKTSPQGAGGDARPGGGKAGGEGSPVPAARPGAEDDDIVARQLREAAEQEKDPVLREKLWKEYDAYKKGSR